MDHSVALASPGRVLGRASVCVLVCGLLWLGAQPAAADVEIGKHAGAFMENGGGARALAMGGAFVAIADDPSATFWNPAGLGALSSREILLMHAERFGDLIDRDFAAYVQPVHGSLLGGQAGGLGVSIIRLGVDDIAITEHIQLDDVNGDGVIDDRDAPDIFNHRDEIYYASDQEWAFLVSYGERRGSWLFGGSLKFIRQDVDKWSSLGLGVDLGLLRRGLWRGLDFGVKIQDATTTYISWSGPDVDGEPVDHNELIAPAIVPGFAYRIPMPAWNMRLLLATSFESRFDNRRGADQYWAGSLSTNVHAGAELAFSDRVYLRGGFDSGWSTENLTAGVGFRILPLTVDYAYAGDILDINEETHRISLSARF
jgi:hypothetical protein